MVFLIKMKPFIAIAVLALGVVGVLADDNDTTSTTTTTTTTTTENPGVNENPRLLKQLAEVFGGEEDVEVNSNNRYGRRPYRNPTPAPTRPPTILDSLLKIFKLGQPAVEADAPPNLFGPLLKLLNPERGADAGSTQQGATTNPFSAFANIFKGLQPTTESIEEGGANPALAQTPPRYPPLGFHYPPPNVQYPQPAYYHPYHPYPYPPQSPQVEQYGKKYGKIEKKAVYAEE